MKPGSRKQQLGVNLIELMIAIVIGLLISLMVVQYLSTSSRLFKQQGADSNLEANGTFAISYLSQFIRQAGTNDPIGSDVPFYVGACDGDDPCTFDNNTSAGVSDQIAVQMIPVNNLDCVGNTVPDGNRIANVFSVQNSSLACRGYDVTADGWLGTAAVELIDGIDELQVLYGVSNNQGQVDRYVDASRVPPAGATDIEIREAWDRVRSAKLAVLVSDGENSGTERQQARIFQLLDSPSVTYTDRVSRKVFSTTVTINSKLP